MIFRFYARVLIFTLLVFTFALLVIHAQPYDDHELRELLLPEGCPAPCFIGIRPGVTTMDEAVKILEASELVKDVDVQSRTIAIYWKWSNLKSAWLDPQGGKIIAIHDSKLVDAIFLYTNISLGEIQMTLNSPDMEIVSLPYGDNTNRYVGHIGIYYQYGLGIKNEVSCSDVEPYRKPSQIMISQSKSNTPLHLNSVSDIFRAC